jgi:hypothetical protein
MGDRVECSQRMSSAVVQNLIRVLRKANGFTTLWAASMSLQRGAAWWQMLIVAYTGRRTTMTALFLLVPLTDLGLPHGGALSR